MQKYYANLLSWLAMSLTITAIILVGFNKLSIIYAIIAVMIAAILDMFDGKVARHFLNKKEDFIFGEITDSLCDTINFGIVPVLIYINIFSNNSLIILIGITIFYLWAVVYRLARFSKTKIELKVKYYQGVPVTVASPLLVLLFIPLQNNFMVGSIGMVVLAFLMISKIKVKKI